MPEFSLTGTVEEIRQHGLAQIENLREKQETLSSLQVHPSVVPASHKAKFPSTNNPHFISRQLFRRLRRRARRLRKN